MFFQGRAFVGANAYGGLLELELEDGMRLTLGDGVNLRLLSGETPAPPKHQLLLSLDDGSKLVATVRMYGGLWAFREGENRNPYYAVARDKPSPFTEAFDAAYFHALLQSAKKTLSAKAFLATEQRIPGLGNGVLQDILLLCGVHPRAKLCDLPEEAQQRMFNSVKSTLARMRAGGGRDTERDLFGAPGGYCTLLCAKTQSLPCPLCGGPVERQAYLGGNVYACPRCQPLSQGG